MKIKLDCPVCSVWMKKKKLVNPQLYLCYFICPICNSEFFLNKKAEKQLKNKNGTLEEAFARI